MKSHLLLAFKHVTWAAFGSWFLRNPNTLLQNLSEKNVLKKKNPKPKWQYSTLTNFHQL